MNFVLDKAGKELIAMGLLPSRTLSYCIVSEMNKAVCLRTETYLTDEEYQTFLRIMAENCTSAKVSLNN
jgi:hypothetical protein